MMIRCSDKPSDATLANLLSHLANAMALASLNLTHGMAGLGHLLDEFSHAAKFNLNAQEPKQLQTHVQAVLNTTGSNPRHVETT